MNDQCKCVITDKKGNSAAGYGPGIDEAFQDALRQLKLLSIPEKGPGIWEMKNEKS